MSNYSKISMWSLLLLSAGLLACGGSGEPSGKNGESEKVKREVPILGSDVKDRSSLVHLIDSLEQIVYNDSAIFDRGSVVALRELYDTFAQRYGGDKAKAPEYLYKSAAISRGLGQPISAIKTYDRILTKFKNFERNSEVGFLIAFTYDEDLNQNDLAKEHYLKVIDKYPGDHWAIQAENRLETIDMSDEEMIEYFMRKTGEIN